MTTDSLSSEWKGELLVMNLCSVPTEVILMISRTIGGPVPNLSGENLCISSSYPPFFFHPTFQMRKCSLKHSHWIVWSQARSQSIYIHVHCHCACGHIHLLMNKAKKIKGTKDWFSHLMPPRSHPSNQIWPCWSDLLPLGLFLLQTDPRQEMVQFTRFIRPTVRLRGMSLEVSCSSVL